MGKEQRRRRRRRDGKVVKFVEHLPFLGFSASVGHKLSAEDTHDPKDEDRAKRAAAACTNSTLSTTCSALGGLIGGALGGPPGLVAGAAAGAALGSLGGQVAEHGINEKIKDKDIQTEKGDFSDLRKRDLLGNAALDTAVSAVTAGLWNTTGAKELDKDGNWRSLKNSFQERGGEDCCRRL